MIPLLLAGLLLAGQPRGPVVPAGGWTSHGPDGGFVWQLTIDPTDPLTLYASAAGIFKSSDGGESWVAITRGLPATVESFALDPQRPSTIYFSAEGGDGSRDFKSTDGGRAWMPIGQIVRKNLYGFPYVATALTVDPASSDTLYAGTAATDSAHGLPQTGEVYKSVDGGSSWQSVLALEGQGAISVLVDAASPSTVYALFGFGLANNLVAGTLYRSLDAGTTWNPVPGLPGSGSAAPPAQSAADPGSLCVGTSAGVFRSRDHGTSWDSISGGLTGDALSVAAVAVAPSDPSVLIATTAAGLFRTFDGGSTWNLVDEKRRQRIAIDPVQPLTLYASGGRLFYGVAGPSDGISKSIDAGTTWSLVDDGLQALAINALAIGPSSADPAAPPTIYAAANTGFYPAESTVFTSEDGGSHWVRHAGTPYYVQDLLLDPFDSGKLYEATYCSGVSRSTDGGDTWVSVSGGLVENDRCINSLAADPTVGGRLYAGTVYGRLFRTDDGGGDWTEIGPTLSDDGNALVAVDPSGSGIVYFGATPGLFRSPDSGATWELTSVQDTIFALEIDPSVPTTVYASSYAGLFRSTDAGVTWQPIPTAPTVPDVTVVSSIAINPMRSSELFITVGATVLRSGDGGATWVPFNAGLLGGLRQLTLDPSATHLYGMATGIFGRPLDARRPLLLPLR
ncbi:MAG TPA: hypothetical protein VGK26_00135 [Thermoanaerobaculia bacterium]|jgi:photosystem II stability/assembly factor-like uncharacterized protein